MHSDRLPLEIQQNSGDSGLLSMGALLLLDNDRLTKSRYIPSMSYGDRLRHAMSYSKMSRKALSNAVGQSVQSIGMVVNGKNRQLSTLASVKAAELMGVNHDWLVTGKGAMVTAHNAAQVTQLSYDALHLGRWLDKIKDPEVRYRTAHTAMEVVLKVLDGPRPAPTPEPATETKTPHVAR